MFQNVTTLQKVTSQTRTVLFLGAAVLALAWLQAAPAQAFCGFYVSKADTDLFNRASKVVIVRDGRRTVLTMANDFQGDPRSFAMVIPVPTVLGKDQIHVADRGLIEHLDAYTAPRLVEYHDPDPCGPVFYERLRAVGAMQESAAPAKADDRARQLGVQIEASYAVGEYDILILSADESRGLETWLNENGYRLPAGASEILGSYLKQGMRFFVAKVNLDAHGETGFNYLRPLQMAFETPKFMLPIRLGTLNADGPQELFVWVLNRTGRVETTNYRTVRLPTNAVVPEFVEHDFGEVYRDLFSHQVKKHDMKAVFLEYAWDMGWCDPCAADPLSPEQLRELGVFWQTTAETAGRRVMNPARDVFVTRLHLRYTAETFPEDLRFQETGDRSNFQGRYILQRKWSGNPQQCRAAREYFDGLGRRLDQEAQTLANLTGRPIAQVRRQAGIGAPSPDADETPWWKKLWASR